MRFTHPAPTTYSYTYMPDITGRKILLVITKSNWGGAQAYVYTLARTLHGAGADVAVVLGGTGAPDAPTGRLASELESNGIRSIHLPSFARDVHLTREFRAFVALIRIFRTEQPYVVHLNSSKAGGLGSLAARIAGVPRIVFTAHGWAHRESRSAFARLLIWLASYATVLFSHATIVVSERDYMDAPGRFLRGRLHLVHNGIAPFTLLPADEARAALTEKCPSIPPTGALFLTSAELHPNKALDVAIRAFSQVHNACLVVMGEGQARPELEALIRERNLDDHVFLAGFVADARTYLAAGTALLLPSFKEGLPMVLLEAGIARLPVIASNTGGIPEVIRDGETGWLITPGSESELADACEAVLTSPEEAEQRGERLHAHVLRNFSEEAMIRGTLAAYLR